MTHILLTNDDGVTAPGLLALCLELRKLAVTVTVLAPDRNWSASGHVKTLHRPLRLSETRLADGSMAYKSDGAPSDCVALALLGALPEKYDLVVSGINPNANIGHDITYSGTVTAAMEAYIGGVSGIAVSLDSPEAFNGVLDYTAAAQAAANVVKSVLIGDFGKAPVLLNVNVPYVDYSALKGYLITRQGQRVYRDVLVKRLDPRGKPYYWIGGDSPTGVMEDGTDFYAIKEGYVSITPLQMDLTDQKMLAEYENWHKTP